MKINDLPDDCLLLVFNHFRCLEDLISFSQVCSRWRKLIAYRFSKAKYLLRKHVEERYLLENRSLVGQLPEEKVKPMDPKFIYIKQYSSLEQNWIKLLPNLKVWQFSSRVLINLNEAECDFTPIKGLIFPSNMAFDLRGKRRPIYCMYRHIQNEHKQLRDPNTIQKYQQYYLRIERFTDQRFFPNLEMVAFKGKIGRFRIGGTLSQRLKQIYINRGFHLPKLRIVAAKFTNLERLHLTEYPIPKSKPVLYNGQVFPKVKILEYKSRTGSNFLGFQDLDLCPLLQSAYFSCLATIYPVNSSIINENLRDLVIDNVKVEAMWRYSALRIMEWDELRDILVKFPNLEHFALRKNKMIDDSHVEKLVEIAPKISLLDFRGSTGVTSQSVDFLNGYCQQTGRSIVLYYYRPNEEEPEDWPKLEWNRDHQDPFANSDPIVQGFDFMRHCFYKDFVNLPYFMES